MRALSDPRFRALTERLRRNEVYGRQRVALCRGHRELNVTSPRQL